MLIQPLAWEPPYAAGAALEKAKRQKKKRKHNILKPMGCCKNSSEREAYSKKMYYDMRRIAGNQHIFIPQGTRKEKQIKPKVGRRKEIKFRA